jgi:hypothetical protein
VVIPFDIKLKPTATTVAIDFDLPMIMLSILHVFLRSISSQCPQITIFRSFVENVPLCSFIREVFLNSIIYSQIQGLPPFLTAVTIPFLNHHELSSLNLNPSTKTIFFLLLKASFHVSTPSHISPLPKPSMTITSLASNHP